ncbi:MAG: oligosaccharide flippase family protein, partial [Hungatella sp.]
MVCLNDKKSSPVKASMWYTICTVVQKGIGMLLVPTYIRLMTTEEYGTYTLFQSWEGIVLIFTTLNLASYAFHNALIKNENRKDWVTGNFLGLICVLTAVVSCVFFLFLNKWEVLFGFSGKYILLMILDSSFVVIIDLWYARNRFEYQYRGVVVVTLLISILNLVLGVIIVSMSQEKAFAAVVARAAIQGIIVVCLAVSIWTKGKSFFDAGLWKYALTFNIP